MHKKTSSESFFTNPGLFFVTVRFNYKSHFLAGLGLLLGVIFSPIAVQAEELSNKKLCLTLGASPNGIPVIEKAVWSRTQQPIFTDTMASDDLNNWVPEKFIPHSPSPISWQLSSDKNFYRAQATRELNDGLRLTWIVELARVGAIFRTKVRMENGGYQALGIKWFPGWHANWQMNDQPESVRWWTALSFEANEKALNNRTHISFGSHLHSSDGFYEAVNPYWVIKGSEQQTFFGIEWCGGWEATLTGNTQGVAFNVRLPQAETQLNLAPGEAIEGPALWVTPTTTTTDALNRQSWMFQRGIVSRRLYGGPQPSFPLNYNYWYATFSEITGAFLHRQVEAMDDYGFENLILDFGWYDKTGLWNPHPTKFNSGELENLLTAAQGKGAATGLWTCPQLIDASIENAPAVMDDLGFFNNRVDGYLIDLAGNDFTAILKNHVTDLRSRYAMSWWKYDQYIFNEVSENGLMKNVVAFQNALREVRRDNPYLAIENCLNGGRMINELTALSSQAIWLSDSQDSGMVHAKFNLTTVLGALEFLFPWQAYHFTNNFDRLPQNDKELTRYYCRSAMLGTWGISSDLSKISDSQKSVILQEIAAYRELNAIKLNRLYEINPPSTGKDLTGITFYDRTRERAGILLFRWDNQNDFTARLALKLLDPEKTYLIKDADTGTQVMMKGSKLVNKGVSLEFPRTRLSALLYVEPIE
ncbi:MAG: alpha-galactosidase [Acidobacteriota bacterium]